MKTPQEFAEAYYAKRGQSVQLLPFFYCTSFVNEVSDTVLVPLTNIIGIDRDSDFVWCDLRAVVSNNNAHSPTDPTQLITNTKAGLTIQLGETGRTFTDIIPGTTPFTIALTDLSGWADRPFILYEPFIVSARTAIFVTLSSTSHLSAVDVAFHGMKAVPGPLA